MANSFKIGSVIPRLFNGSKYETDVARPSNQNVTFTGTSNPFKVNVLTADVFETTAFTGATPTTSEISKIKRLASTFVGSLGEAFPTFKRGIETIAEFCGKVKSGITGMWDFLHNTNVPSIADAGRAIKARIEEANYTKEVNMYASKPVSALEKELRETLSIAA